MQNGFGKRNEVTESEEEFLQLSDGNF